MSRTLSANDSFWIGNEDLLTPQSSAMGSASSSDGVDEAERDRALADIRVRIGTLLKTDTVSFLLGAGASVDCGGLLIGSVPLALERALHSRGITGQAGGRVRRWLTVFYLAARSTVEAAAIPATRSAIIRRYKAMGTVSALPVNLEAVLARLHTWRTALSEESKRLRIDGVMRVDVLPVDLDRCISEVTRALACSCVLPLKDRADGLSTYKTFLRKVLTRPLNLKRTNLFTLNYDTLVEQAADAEGVVLLDGFVGTKLRIFRPESYRQDLYFPAETTEGRVHRFDRVAHLYKLHGSIDWVATDSSLANPYGVQCQQFEPDSKERLLVYPTPTKVGETLGMPYAELFRRFANAVVRPQSVLFVVGYGFGDEHVNTIIHQALIVPSFRLVIVDPSPKSDFVSTLRKHGDQRVWISQGQTLGKFAGFVDAFLPDLRDEEILKKVLETHRALERGPGPPR